MHNPDFYEQRFEEAIDIEHSSTNKLDQTVPSDTAKVCGQQEKPLGKNTQNAALRRQFVLYYLKDNALIRNAELCEGLGVSPPTVNRIPWELREDGTLERVRDGKFWAYRLAVNENH